MIKSVLLLSLTILFSIYIVKNKKIKDSSKTGWFAVVVIVAGLILILKLL